MNELRPQEMQPIQTATGDEIYTSQKTSLAKEKQDVRAIIQSCLVYTNLFKLSFDSI